MMGLYFVTIEFILIGIIGGICGAGLRIEGTLVISYMALFCAFLCGIMIADIKYQKRKQKKKE